MEMILGVEYSAGVPKRMVMLGKGYSKVLSFPSVEDRNQWIGGQSNHWKRDEIGHTAIKQYFPRRALEDLESNAVHFRE